MLDPKTDKYPYPEITDRHYLKIKKNSGETFESDYPFIDKSGSFLFRQRLVRLLLNLFVFPAARVRLGLRIDGKENLKKHKDVIGKGVISCSNHIHMWDYISIMKSIKTRKPYVLVWAPNVAGENGALIRLVGGVPIPESGAGATKAYLNALREMLDDGGWLQVYSEGSMWEYYRPIRPFKHGAAYLACEFDKPILPMAFSYREPNKLRKKLFGQIALLTLNIGEPLFPDRSLKRREQKKDLTIRSHRAVCELAGIDPGKNIYPPVFENTERVDYYTDTYGKGYRHSL